MIGKIVVSITDSVVKQAELMKSSERKIEIINSALKIIGESGLSGLTTARIAEEVKITEAALYRHFKSKNEILVSTVNLIGKKLLATIEAISAEHVDAAARLYKILDLHLNHIQQNKGIPRIIYSQETHSEPELRKNLDMVITNYLKVIEGIIKNGMKTRQFSEKIEPDVEAMRFLSIIQFTAFRYSLSGFKKNSIQNGKSLWNAFIEKISA